MTKPDRAGHQPDRDRKPMSERQRLASDWLEDSADYQRALEQVDTLLAIRSQLARLRPDLGLGVISLHEGLLTLQARNAAMAARARQSEPSLRASLAADWPELRQIRFAPRRVTLPAAPQRAPRAPIPPAALAAMAALGARLEEDTPLRAAVQRLVARRRTPGS